MSKIEFFFIFEYCHSWQAANLSNKDCAEYLGVKTRTIGRWRISNPVAPKAAIIALETYISKM